MTLTQEQIQKISVFLSKIRLESPKLGDDIEETIKYMDLLNEINTEGVPETNSVIEKENILRKDEISQNLDPIELLNCTNQKVVAKQIALPNIMK